MIGRVLSRYRLLEEVGRGGMAVVYRGEDTLLGREVAVKVLHPHLASLPESRARLEREAQAVAKLRHDNILEIFDYSGPESPDRFLVTEFIHGETLTAFIARHRLPLPELAEMIVAEVTAALEHAHAAGIIHRDVKPENVMIRRDGVLKLTDFGIAQIVDKEKLTMTGQLLGSPAYMAPENIEGGTIDFRTDVFAAGILLYQLATGELPFRGKNPHQVLKKIAECQYVPPEQLCPRVGTRLGRIIRRALMRRQEDRYPSVAAMRAELCEDLAEAGIAEPRRELGRFFAAPEEEGPRLRERVVAALVERGRAHVAGGRQAAALAAWARALGYAPERRDVQALVDGLARRRRRGRLAAAVGLSLAAAGSGVLAVRHFVTAAREPSQLAQLAAVPAAARGMQAAPSANLAAVAAPVANLAAAAAPSAITPAAAAMTPTVPSATTPTAAAMTPTAPSATTPTTAAATPAAPSATTPTTATATPAAPNATTPMAAAAQPAATPPGIPLAAPSPVLTSSVAPAALSPAALATPSPPPLGRAPARPAAPRRPTAAHAATRAVTIHTIPKNVDIFVDGAFVASYSGPPIQVAPGPHELTFRSPSGCCAETTVRIGADDTASPLVRLLWKSARLVIATQPAAADVVFTTSKRTSPGVARGGQSIPIPVPAESETGEVDVHVTVSAPGFASRELDVKARAGQTSRYAIELPRAP